MSRTAYAPARWHLISLRPSGEHAALRRAVARLGGQLVAVSPWRLQRRGDDATRAALAKALQCPLAIFTSPAAASAALALQPTARPTAHGGWLAVGAGTARILQRAGITDVIAPQRVDSEGLLALGCLAAPKGLDIGLITAPGGRGVIASELQRRGARLWRADVYARVPMALAPRTLRALHALPANPVLALSSGEALQQVIGQLPEALADHWRQQMPVVAASDRLARLASDAGFTRVSRADGPRPAQLAAAAAQTLRPPH